MTVLAGYIPENLVAVDSGYITTDLDGYEFTPTELDTTEIPITVGFAPKTNVWVDAWTSVKTGFMTVNYGDDFYDRIHIDPSQIALGNLISVQTRSFYVWNAYRKSSKLLSSITATGAGDLTLLEPAPPPTTFAPTEERVYTVTVGLAGVPNLDATYQFIFPDEEPAIRITGSRVVVFPFKPTYPHEERYEHLTDVQRTITGENRISLLHPARQVLSYNYVLDERDFSRAKAITSAWSSYMYGVPVWMESQVLTSLAMGATSITVNTMLSDYRTDGLALLWKSSEEFEAIELTTVTGGSLSLKLPLSRSWSNVRIMPLRLAYTPQGTYYKRQDQFTIAASSEFLVNENKEQAVSPGFTTYRSKPVYFLPNVVASGLAERIVKSVDILDNGTGPITIMNNFDVLDFGQQLNIFFDGLTERKQMIGWVETLRGKYGTFWLPSNNTDLELTAYCAPGTSVLIVRSINYRLYYTTKDIVMFMKDGTKRFYRITGAAEDGDNEELTITTTVGIDLYPEDVDKISFMSHVRLNTDTVTINYVGPQQAFIDVNVIEVPE